MGCVSVMSKSFTIRVNERNLSLLQNGSSPPTIQSDCLREKHFYLIQTFTRLMSHLFIYCGYQLA